MGRRLALLIGSSEYADASFAPLPSAAQDVSLMDEVLRTLGNFEVISLLNEPWYQLQEEVARFFDTKARDDVLLLYFSGHGKRDPDDGRLYFVAHDTKANNLRGTALAADFVRSEMLRPNGSRRQIIILDCCHSGGFSLGAKGDANADLVADLETIGKGRIVLAASAPLEQAWEGNKFLAQLKNSLFTYCLVEGLQTGAASRDGGEQITVQDAFAYACHKVMDIASERQTPKMIGEWEGAEPFLIRNPHPRLTDLSEDLQQAIENPLARGLADAGERKAKSKKEVRQSVFPLGTRFSRPNRKWWIMVFGGLALAILPCLLALNCGGFALKALGLLPPFVSVPPTPTLDPTLSPPSNAKLGDTWRSPADDMTLVYVPTGTFLMGTDDSDIYTGNDEKPRHTVYLGAYWIDRTEVTNAMYAQCVKAGKCQPPSDYTSWSRQGYYYGESQYDQYPVIYVSWNDAQAYCAWAGRRLPTEAQWEKAARGTDGRRYPWGNQTPNSTLANFYGDGQEIYDTNRVGKYPAGASPYGALDMAGNVNEWVNDWFSENYYRTSPASNPPGPSTGKRRIVRGGSWSSGVPDLRTTIRGGSSPTSAGTGIRCVGLPSPASAAVLVTTPPQPSDTLVSLTITPSPSNTPLLLTRPSPPIPPILMLSSTQTTGMDTTRVYTDGMMGVYVPAGAFLMGSTDTDIAQALQGCPYCNFNDEKPQHTVYLDAFWIDQTEVTNALYAKCVKAGKCQPPDPTISSAHNSYYGYPAFDNYPVIWVSWNDATAYCGWAGRRLPTEAEWEKAARGVDGRKYPWGGKAPDQTLLNFNGYLNGITEVGKYPAGASLYGALDMAGNVSELVADWYAGTYYASSPDRNPTGPASGQSRVLRGGAWDTIAEGVRAASRGRIAPNDRYYGNYGFRCSHSATSDGANATPLPPIPTSSSRTESVPTLSIGPAQVYTDGMVGLYVPAGEFLMGSTDADQDAYTYEKPQHTVYLDAYWIDKTEVTQGMYALCVAAGKCQKTFASSGGDNYPVIYALWNDAKAYCEWAKRRLPTEAEWEKAARGTDGRKYPWGDTAPGQTLLNFNNQVGHSTEVGHYPAGVSPYGALDMAGNVWEWVADWYSDTYYASSPTRNPTGPTSGQERVWRGGAWLSDAPKVRAADRNWFAPDTQDLYGGFRCARSP